MKPSLGIEWSFELVVEAVVGAVSSGGNMGGRWVDGRLGSYEGVCGRRVMLVVGVTGASSEANGEKIAQRS